MHEGDIRCNKYSRYRWILSRYPLPGCCVRLILNTAPVSDFAQTVKQQADIVKVIEGYIRLQGPRESEAST